MHHAGSLHVVEIKGSHRMKDKPTFHNLSGEYFTCDNYELRNVFIERFKIFTSTSRKRFSEYRDTLTKGSDAFTGLNRWEVAQIWSEASPQNQKAAKAAFHSVYETLVFVLIKFDKNRS